MGDLVIWLAVLVAVFAGIAVLGQMMAKGQVAVRKEMARKALSDLDGRLASGEITKDEHARRKRELRL